MTLSRFLRDYLYIALGGNRAGVARRYANLMATMVLGGLWHGAGWTFVAWGAMHGACLVLHQGWLRWRGDAPRAPAWWGVPLTFLAVMLAWVVFRAPDLATAGDILGALAGANGVSLPRGLQGLAAPLAELGLHPEFNGLRWMALDGPGLPVLLLSAVLAFAAPNTQEIFCHYKPCIERIFRTVPGRAWRPSPGWSMALAALFISCVFNMNRVSEFLYFQF
jgi:hypothetical protein